MKRLSYAIQSCVVPQTSLLECTAASTPSVRCGCTLDEERYRSIAEIAETEKIDRSFISRLLLLTLLAPDIQEAILEGRQAKGMQLEELTGRVSSAWEKQRERFAPPDRIRDPMF